MSGSDLELNKMAAAILVASLIAMIVGVVANALYKPKLEVAQRGYQVEVAEEGTVAEATKASAEIVDIKILMASANAEAGRKIFKKCVSCHTVNKNGSNKVGPNLWNIVNAQKGEKPGFAYSKAMLASGGSWDEENMFAFLTKPSKYLPGTKMSFRGIKKPTQVADVIAYLQKEAS
ncbi:MAG: cytochrome c family protein [Rickettsiales bacterium]|nr:MAG: cytochrome c family protein [Rickettsiales bacterium]